jgi:hypothetical protein
MMADVMHYAADDGCVSGSSKQCTNGEDIKALLLSMEKIIMGMHSNNVASIIGIFFLAANWFLACAYENM